MEQLLLRMAYRQVFAAESATENPEAAKDFVDISEVAVGRVRD
jgi:hypothetical protein